LFIYLRSVYLRDTDATGVLYFPQQFDLALEAFEEFLKQGGFSLGELVNSSDFLLPVVHAEADYLAPLQVGDTLEITLSVKNIGTSSFTLHTEMLDKDKKQKVGHVSVVHVAISKATKTKIPLPKRVQDLLLTLKQ
jgi:YbgC/YbaW family acyl-CoA thioester hydrolase